MSRRKLSRSRSLGASIQHHRAEVRALVSSVESEARLAQTGSCGIRLTSLEAALYKHGQLWAHAFRSGGRVARGALSPKTISTADARRVYAAGREVEKAVDAFRQDCLRR